MSNVHVQHHPSSISIFKERRSRASLHLTSTSSSKVPVGSKSNHNSLKGLGATEKGIAERQQKSVAESVWLRCSYNKSHSSKSK
jgi:hypothetical protein